MRDRSRARRWRRHAGAAVWMAVLATAQAGEPPIPPPSRATLEALRVQRSGEAVTLGSLLPADEPAVVALWASYCVACRAEGGVLADTRSRFKDRGMRVMIVLADVDDPAAAKRFASDVRAPVEPLPIAKAQEDAAEDLAPEGFPTNYLVRGERVQRIDRLLKAADVAAFFQQP